MFSCEQCQYQASSEAILKYHQDTVHQDTNVVIYVEFSYQVRQIYFSLKGLCMKESNTHADNVVISQLQRGILLSIKHQGEFSLVASIKVKFLESVTKNGVVSF